MSRYQASTGARVVRITLVVLGVLLVVFAGLFVWDAFRLRSAAADLRVHAADARAAISERDVDALRAQVTLTQDAAREFASASSGPHWWVANHLPWLKEQTLPLSRAGESTLRIADGVLAPLSEMENLDALAAPPVENGRIDPFFLEPYRETLAAAAAVVEEEQAALADVSLNGTVPQVAEPFRGLRADLAAMGQTVVGAHVAAELMPGMLGADGPRTYVVAVQNNAEPRTTGGIPGAFVELTVDDGVISLGRFTTAVEMFDPELEGVTATEDEKRIWGTRVQAYPQDANFTPDFPRTGEIIDQFWTHAWNEKPDGVVSIDPVALGYMLQGAQPIELMGVTLTSDNVAEVLMKDSYLTFPEPADQDAFFAAASAALFSQLLDGGTHPVQGVQRAIDEDRFMLWSADEEEQALLAGTDISGSFSDQPQLLGIFFNDGSATKIGYYVDSEVVVTDLVCPDGRLKEQLVEVTLSHTFDGDVASLPWYVAGGKSDIPVGEFHGEVVIYPAVGTGVTGVDIDGEKGMIGSDFHEGRLRGVVWVRLKPQESTTVTFRLEPDGSVLDVPGLRITPRAKPSVYERTLVNADSGC